MSHFAKIENNIVVRVAVAEQDWVDQQEGEWIQTSYNTYKGVHALGGTPLRHNYAGQGFIYDRERDVFLPPKPFASWSLNTETLEWEAPISKPTPNETTDYFWNEEELSWKARKKPNLR